jgi:hypothetical protein
MIFDGVFGNNIFFEIALQAKVPLAFCTIIEFFEHPYSFFYSYFLFFIFKCLSHAIFIMNAISFSFNNFTIVV